MSFIRILWPCINDNYECIKGENMKITDEAKAIIYFRQGDAKKVVNPPKDIRTDVEILNAILKKVKRMKG